MGLGVGRGGERVARLDEKGCRGDYCGLRVTWVGV